MDKEVEPGKGVRSKTGQEIRKIAKIGAPSRKTWYKQRDRYADREEDMKEGGKEGKTRR